MTIKENNNLLSIKNNIFHSYDFTNISDAEFYEIVAEKCSLDLVDLDLLDFKEHEEDILDWMEELEAIKQATLKLEALFIYIENQGFELDSFLNSIDYNEDIFDIATLSLEELVYVEQQLEGLLADIEYFTKLDDLENMLLLKEEAKKANKYLDIDVFLDTLENEPDSEIEALKKEIEALKSSNKLKTLKHNLEELQIIQAKDFLSASELAVIYPNMSLNRQVTYRGRIHDPLPFQQLKRGAKITYNRKAVDIWIINNNK